ncbi:MAG: sigma-54 factor interaction domain-containing protein, partial [Desulfobacteraceae bacterium]|nr:sigma-54 factor interaction domain-containing protein [Desulfobacteraceae bacterium]
MKTPKSSSRERIHPGSPVGTVEALGHSEVFLEFEEHLSRVAPVNRPVLLIGERGTGKELAARRLHYLSTRWKGPLVTLNCSALTPSLIESELFGYERGAFTGAEKRRTGRFEAADGGTLFLDEIGDMSLQAQAKLLRSLEEKKIRRVGGQKEIDVDVRILSATNKNIKRLIEEDKFREDLYYRLN